MSSNYCLSCGFGGLELKPYLKLPDNPDLDCVTPPYDQTWGKASGETCPCCGYTFGLDDRNELRPAKTFRQYFESWFRAGAVWVDEERKPLVFDAERQLSLAGLKVPFCVKRHRAIWTLNHLRLPS